MVLNEVESWCVLFNDYSDFAVVALVKNGKELGLIICLAMK